MSTVGPIKARPSFTELEASVLFDAALSIGDDIDELGWSPARKAAYQRAMRKLARACNTTKDRRVTDADRV